MALIQKFENGPFSEIHLHTQDTTLLFDYHTSIYGTNFGFISFDKPKKPLKFVVKNIAEPDAVFVTSSSSIGILFLKNTKIYLTRPVFEQILLKYEQLKALNLSYDDLDEKEILEKYFPSQFKSKIFDENDDLTKIKRENKNVAIEFDASKRNEIGVQEPPLSNSYYKICSINDINIEELMKNIVFIKYNQKVNLMNHSIQSLPSGTFIGWCNYKIKFPNQKEMLILTSYSSKRRFSVEATSVNCDYLIINRPSHSSFDSIETLSNYICQYANTNRKDIKPLLIPIDLPNFFIEILFHVLSIIGQKGVPITVVSRIFNKLDLLLNVHSEWLNRDFYSISEPFPVKKYVNFRIVNGLFDVEICKNFVFCSIEEYELYGEKIAPIFDFLLINKSASLHWSSPRENDTLISQEIVEYKIQSSLPGIETVFQDDFTDPITLLSTKAFNIKIESTNEDILSTYKGKLMTLDSFYIQTESAFYPVLIDSRLPVLNNSILLHGEIEITDKETPGVLLMNLKDKKISLSELLNEEVPVFADGWFIFKSIKIKFRLRNSKQIEFIKF